MSPALSLILLYRCNLWWARGSYCMLMPRGQLRLLRLLLLIMHLSTHTLRPTHILQPCAADLQSCQCQTCGSAGTQWPSKCCEGFYCGCSGNRWSGYQQVCIPIPTSYRSFGTAPSASCSAAGRDCSIATGKQCCEGANLDCVLQSNGNAKCVSRAACSGVGSTCKGLGDCCGGLVCGDDNKCKVAECQPKSSCKKGDAVCDAKRSMGCEVVYAAAMGSPINATLAASASIIRNSLGINS